MRRTSPARFRHGVWVATLFLVAYIASPGTSAAHQPVMDMAPRWAEGFGFQIRNEYRSTDKVLRGKRRVSNPGGREQSVNTTWLEGIYTFSREVRVTLKVPFVVQKRDALVGASVVRREGRGLGDSVLAVPLKKYWNLKSSTVNIGLTPQLRIPTGSTGAAYAVGDGSWDFGLSASFNAENVDWYTLADAFWWENTKGKRGIRSGDSFGLDFNLGYHTSHNNTHNLGSFAMLDLEVRHDQRGVDQAGTTGGTRVTLGPVLVGYWNNIMLRGEVKVPVYERVFGIQFSRGILYNLGVGATF